MPETSSPSLLDERGEIDPWAVSRAARAQFRYVLRAATEAGQHMPNPDEKLDECFVCQYFNARNEQLAIALKSFEAA